MAPRRHRWLVAVILLALALCAAGVGRASRLGLDLVPPHSVRASEARLDAPARARLRAAVAGAAITTVGDALVFALGVSGSALHLGLGHPTSLSFSTAEREGNCVEYAQLFA